MGRRAKKRRVKKKQKRGIPFEQAVRDVIALLHPQTDVRQGEWVQGPDGRRDLDVYADILIDGVTRRLLFECKDYNPERGPLGIEFVDNLDSKRRDLNLDAAFICSNAGFTEDAVRKSRRVGIGLIGVFREGDKRIRYEVRDEIYYRHIRIDRNSVSVSFSPGAGPGGEARHDQLLHAGAPVLNWVGKEMLRVIAMNPIVNGAFAQTYKLKKPTEFVTPKGSIVAEEISYQFAIVGNWYSKIITIGGTAGLYDWLTWKIRQPHGGGTIQIKFGELDGLTGGQLIDRPPAEFMFPAGKLGPGESRWNMLRISGYAGPDNPIQQPLDDAIEPAEFVYTIPNLPEEVTRSKGTPIDSA